MAETKRVSDQYKISAPSIVIDGNLTVTGSTTSVETINSTVKDNIIVLNDGEVGAGVTAGTAGIEIDRGSQDNATLTYNETADVWEIKVGSSYTNIRGAAPVSGNDLTTKDYVDLGASANNPAGSLYSVQFNNQPSGFGGDSNFTYDTVTVTIQDVEITTGSIQTTTTNGDLEIAANGSGTLYLRSVIKMENEISDPSATVGTNKVYSKTPGNAGSGLYFVNSTASDEFVSRSKAILFGLIF
jgi:hypothetical protein